MNWLKEKLNINAGRYLLVFGGGVIAGALFRGLVFLGLAVFAIGAVTYIYYKRKQ
jgi:hypothetical protein